MVAFQHFTSMESSFLIRGAIGESLWETGKTASWSTFCSESDGVPTSATGGERSEVFLGTTDAYHGCIN